MKLAKLGEVEFGVGIGGFGAAAFEDGLAGAFHVCGVDVIAAEFERVVAFDGGGEVGFVAWKFNPGAVAGTLLVAKMVGEFGEVGVVLLADDPFVEDVFGFKNGVALQFGAPVAVGILLKDERFNGGVERLVEAIGIGGESILADVLIVWVEGGHVAYDIGGGR